MTEIPDSYDPADAEAHWRAAWADSDVYEYDSNEESDTEERPDYIIDTPPPYPTGNLHIGNALGWCYMDFLARYHRLEGHNVSFPQGWDCHGLPTEVKVEENEDIHRTDVPREEFRRLCVEHTDSQIGAMRETMQRLGFSQDWSQEFRTMDSEYWGKTQRSFVEMADSDLVYREEHPVNWCPRCETAIADAEVETIDRDGTLHTLTFPGVDNDDIEIATTRPELLAACVSMAVNPEDERYDGRIGETFEVPLFGQEIELIADEDVDPEFGSGAVMICTFGDKQDVSWWAEYDLDLRAVFTEDGQLNELAGAYEGLSIEDAKTEIAGDLEEEGYLLDSNPTEQSVGSCWRCDTPIEILSKEQWFVRVDQEEVLERAQAIEWIPEHMYGRLEEWAEGMEWDWVISRQRVFATPIPAWFCTDCGESHIAPTEELPIDPTEAEPATDCPSCGADAWKPETDVMDTWMDSSISAMHVAGWPEQEFEPVQLRPQGHDIIRTWAFYTILRTAELTDEIPWESILINGMVFGEDGHKMSKSRDNFVQPEEVVEEDSADAFRQAIALGGQPGSDIQFQHKEVTSASRFITKLWNVFRFAEGHFEAETPAIDAPAYRDADRWIRQRTNEVAEEMATEIETYRFDRALRTVREFVWEDLADDYLELIKGRLYNGRPGERDAARHALYSVISAVVRMLGVFTPFVAEEIWEYLPGTEGSVHTADWPALETGSGDPDALEEARAHGEVITTVASEVRAWKSEHGLALPTELERIDVYLDDEAYPELEVNSIDTYDLSEAVSAPIRLESGEPTVELEPVGVEPDHSEIGPAFREQANAVASALEAADPARIESEQRAGEIDVEVDGETKTVDPEMVEIVEEYRAASGETVEVLDTDVATVLVIP